MEYFFLFWSVICLCLCPSSNKSISTPQHRAGELRYGLTGSGITMFSFISPITCGTPKRTKEKKKRNKTLLVIILSGVRSGLVTRNGIPTRKQHREQIAEMQWLENKRIFCGDYMDSHAIEGPPGFISITQNMTNLVLFWWLWWLWANIRHGHDHLEP